MAWFDYVPHVELVKMWRLPILKVDLTHINKKVDSNRVWFLYLNLLWIKLIVLLFFFLLFCKTSVFSHCEEVLLPFLTVSLSLLNNFSIEVFCKTNPINFYIRWCLSDSICFITFNMLFLKFYNNELEYTTLYAKLCWVHKIQ